jgi:dephospho-CoA kinase
MQNVSSASSKVMLSRLRAHGYFRVIGLTGNIASGKSHARACLDELGAHTIDADSMCHRAYEPGAGAYDPIVAAFGSHIVGTDGNIDRAQLGKLVFQDQAALKTLQSKLID